MKTETEYEPPVLQQIWGENVQIAGKARMQMLLREDYVFLWLVEKNGDPPYIVDLIFSLVSEEPNELESVHLGNLYIEKDQTYIEEDIGFFRWYIASVNEEKPQIVAFEQHKYIFAEYFPNLKSGVGLFMKTDVSVMFYDVELEEFIDFLQQQNKRIISTSRSMNLIPYFGIGQVMIMDVSQAGCQTSNLNCPHYFCETFCTKKKRVCYYATINLYAEQYRITPVSLFEKTLPWAQNDIL